MMKPSFLFATAIAVLASPALAQDAVTGSWTLGVVQTPEYEGAEETQTLPLLGFRLERDGRRLEFQGTSLRADLVRAGNIEAGPVLNYRFGRKDVADTAVARLPEIDGTVELGGHVSISFPAGQGAVRIGAEVLADVGGVHDGVIGTLSAGYGAALSDRLSLGAAVSVTAVSDGYAETYFSVSAAGAAASGLEAYTAGGGLKDAGLDLSLGYALSDRNTITGLVSYRRLLGDVADSPVAAAADQVTFGLAFTRSF